jgi:PPIC-type PPIASE domain
MVCTFAIVGACADRDDPSSRQDSEQPWAVRVGEVTLDPQVVSVGLIADPEGTRAVRNFTLAAALRAREAAGAEWLRRAALAHALADELAASAVAQGPPTDAELASWTEAHWLEVDRPRAARCIHAVVLLAANATGSEREAARALAERIRNAVAGAATLDEFRAKALAEPAAELKVKVEELQAVAADGRVVRLGSAPGAPVATYDDAFARAASALTGVGETSPIVASAFGYHVLRLVEVTPELRVAADERRALAARDVFDMRARHQLVDHLAIARAREGIGIERSAEEATARVQVE